MFVLTNDHVEAEQRGIFHMKGWRNSQRLATPRRLSSSRQSAMPESRHNQTVAFSDGFATAPPASTPTSHPLLGPRTPWSVGRVYLLQSASGRDLTIDSVARGAMPKALTCASWNAPEEVEREAGYGEINQKERRDQ